MANPLLTTKAPDAALSVQLHPLVLLTITDYITRHISRQQPQPIVGAVIGQQNGRTVTLEHAYEVKTDLHPQNSILINGEFFTDRLEQYKDVHKAPALDLQAVFMLGSVEGPEDEHARVVKQVQQLSGMDAVMLVLFHAEMVDQLQGGKLPITLYESVLEQQDGGEAGQQDTKFREQSFEVETGEAEMIAVDFVATGGGNATAVPKAAEQAQASSTAEASGSKTAGEKKGKGKGKSKEEDTDPDSATNVLSPEDEELIASLTAKANAIKMLTQRINLIRSYLQSLPPSYLTSTDSPNVPADDTNYVLLRSINALLSRLPLLAPPSPTSNTTSAGKGELHVPPSLASAAAKEKEDVHLTTLLASLTRSIAEAQSLSSKFYTVTREKNSKDRNMLSGGGRGGSGSGFGGDEGYGGGPFGAPGGSGSTGPP